MTELYELCRKDYGKAEAIIEKAIKKYFKDVKGLDIIARYNIIISQFN